jgi:hypothetical protein
MWHKVTPSVSANKPVGNYRDEFHSGTLTDGIVCKINAVFFYYIRY